MTEPLPRPSADAPLVAEARRTLAAHDDDRHDLLHLADSNDPVVLGCVWCQS